MISMENQNVFKWKHYQPDIILLTVRWYLRYNLSFRDLVEMMEERGLSMANTTIMRWVHQYGPELDERVRRHLKPTNDSWRVDETYIKVKGQWMYLYRANDLPQSGAIVEQTQVENDQTLFQSNIKAENNMQDFMQKVGRCVKGWGGQKPCR